MKSLGRAVASGAVWMVALKLIERSIGFVSTVILARLLVPADFGLVAMSMALFAILEVIGSFGFDQALIRQRSNDPAQFNTAWTLTVCHGIFSATVLLLVAGPAAAFFKDPRLESIVQVLALAAFVQGFENIGIVLYRKELQFRKDFAFFLGKKLLAFAVTVSLAFWLRSYWALVAGIVVSRTAGVVLSYLVNSYRPRISFAATGDLFRFSRWILLNGLLDYTRGRSPDFILGRFASAGTLGVFRISSELASLPTSELMYPVMRAAYPGYSKVAHDRLALKRAFLSVQGMVITLTLPAGIGIALLADPIVRVLLGPNWLAAVPIVQVLALHGALRVFRLTNNAVFNVLGAPYWNTAFSAIETITIAPVFGWLIYSGVSLDVAVWAYLAASSIVVPFAVMVMSRYLRLSFGDRLATMWRPVLGCTTMAVALILLGDTTAIPTDARSSITVLAIFIPVGACVYFVTIIGSWWLAGRPVGPETRALDLLSRSIEKLTSLQWKRSGY